MAELETINRARVYFDKMSQGINPLTDEPVSSDDLIRNESISFCLAYVSLLLTQIVEQGGISPSIQHSNKEADVSEITTDKLDAFEFSDTPISINNLVQRVQTLSLGKKLTSELLTKWLIETSLLIREDSESFYKSYSPTENGKSIGLIAIDNRNRKSILLDNNAQHFIVDNLSSIISFSDFQKENQGKPWLPEDDTKLKELYLEGLKIKDLATEFRRSTGAIRSRLIRLGLVQNEP